MKFNFMLLSSLVLILAIGSNAQSPIRSSELFSIESIKSDTYFLAADALDGRPAGSAGNAIARKWIIDRLMHLHVRPAGDLNFTTFEHSFTGIAPDYYFNGEVISGVNIIGIVYPNNVWTDSPPKVFLSAHYDHVGGKSEHNGVVHFCPVKLGNVDNVCNGATDNATGVAAALAAVSVLAEKIQAPVAIAFWDAEEWGLVGSHEYLKKPTIDLSEVNAVLNLDGLGLNKFKNLENSHLILGLETGGQGLKDIANEAIGKSDRLIEYQSISYAFAHKRNDTASFVQNEYKIPVVLFTDGDGSVYHTNSDEAQYVNYTKVFSVTQVVTNMAIALSQMDGTKLQFVEPQVASDTDIPQGIPKWLNRVPDVNDAKALIHVYTRVIENGDVNQLDGPTLQNLEQNRNTMIAILNKGVANVSVSERMSLIGYAAYLSRVSRSLKFIP